MWLYGEMSREETSARQCRDAFIFGCRRKENDGRADGVSGGETRRSGRPVTSYPRAASKSTCGREEFSICSSLLAAGNEWRRRRRRPSRNVSHGNNGETYTSRAQCYCEGKTRIVVSPAVEMTRVTCTECRRTPPPPPVTSLGVYRRRRPTGNSNPVSVHLGRGGVDKSFIYINIFI